jgi:hypothetical protein
MSDDMFVSDSDLGLSRCGLCHAEFDSPVALLEHIAIEDDQLYDVDGGDDA